MNYLAEIIAFEKWRRSLANPMPSREVHFWYYLMAENNFAALCDAEGYYFWPAEIVLANSVLQRELKVNYRILWEIRTHLKAAGRLKVSDAEGNGKNAYQLIPFNPATRMEYRAFPGHPEGRAVWVTDPNAEKCLQAAPYKAQGFEPLPLKNPTESPSCPADIAFPAPTLAKPLVELPNVDLPDNPNSRKQFNAVLTRFGCEPLPEVPTPTPAGSMPPHAEQDPELAAAYARLMDPEAHKRRLERADVNAQRMAAVVFGDKV